MGYECFRTERCRSREGSDHPGQRHHANVFTGLIEPRSPECRHEKKNDMLSIRHIGKRAHRKVLGNMSKSR